MRRKPDLQLLWMELEWIQLIYTNLMNLVNLKTTMKLKLWVLTVPLKKIKKSPLSFANAGCISALWTHSVAAWPHLSHVHGHHDMLLPCHRQKDVFYQAMSQSQDRMSMQMPSCDSERAQSLPALFKWPEFWLHDAPYFVPATCQGRDFGDYAENASKQGTTIMTDRSLKLTFCPKLTLEKGEQRASPIPED